MYADYNFLAVLAVAVLFVGLFAGIVAGLLGVGGGIVIVPALYHVFTLLGIDEDVKMHLAVGTSLATIIPTSIASLRAHRRRGAVDTDLLRSWGPSVAVGVLTGTMLVTVARGQVLTAVFATVALIVCIHMAFSKEHWRISDNLPTGPVKHAVAGGIGAFSAMMGIGGGTLMVPTLVLCNFSIKRAVGTAAAVGLIIGIPGAIGLLISGLGVPNRPPFSLGYISLVGFAIIAPASMLTAPYGARIAHALPTRALRRAFALFLALTSARMFYGLFH